jgi:hypothetical protein
MSNQLHKINIDLMKITGASKIKAKDGKEYLAIDLTQSGVFVGQKGGVYLSLDMRENRDGEDQYGNSHMVTISPTKEQRAAKERTPIVGNAKTLTFGSTSAPSAAPRQTAQKDASWIEDDSQDVPF